MKKTMMLTLGCALFACSSSVGFAQKTEGAPMLDKIFARLDQNQNGSIDADEVPEKMKSRLGNADANNDGKIEKTELAAMHRQGKVGPGKGAGKGHGRSHQGKPGTGANDRGPQERLKQMLAKVDRNQDGKISAEEAPEKMKERFAQFDSNGDQFVDRSELQTMIAKLRQGASDRGAGKEGRTGKGKEKVKGERNSGEEGPAPRRPKRPENA
jgi:Ca2+-binding EF-hand superfamily protein